VKENAIIKHKYEIISKLYRLSMEFYEVLLPKLCAKGNITFCKSYYGGICLWYNKKVRFNSCKLIRVAIISIQYQFLVGKAS
jgi:hypothetical protein